MSEPDSITPEATTESAQSLKPAIERGGYSPFPIVGIGASAGGLDALRGLLAALPPNPGMAFLIVQHLDPNHDSQLTELLGRATPLPVTEATHGLAIEPDHVYVIPPNTNMAITQGKLTLTPRDGTKGLHLPVDHLFRSLAEEQQGRAIGIVLSGTGSDGTLGLGEIKSAGGITFAQDEASAAHAGMPHSAAQSGSVDCVLPVEEIARSLHDFAAHPYLNAAAMREALDESQVGAAFKKILSMVRAAHGVDFTFYRDTTLRRRIFRRMALRRLEQIVEYARLLEGDREEVEALYHDMLINVTSFFRDPGMFEALKSRVYPALAKHHSADAPIRIWVPGCSTGQEAYSIAMTLIEFFEDEATRPRIQIFATDLTDQTTLDRARAGIYPDSIEADVSPERLRRFFRKEDHSYRIDKFLRDTCVFARHNVAADPPFSHLDMISCRNVLIYLGSSLHKQVLPMFHYALGPRGFLVLGTAESIGDHADLFELVDPLNRIYAKKPNVGHRVVRFPTGEQRKSAAPPRQPEVEPATATAEDFQREADRVLLGRFSPPGVLVNEAMEVLQFRGRTSAFLEAPPGEPTANLFKLAREGLVVDLRNALQEVRKIGRPVRRDGVRIRVDGEQREISLEVIPIRPQGGDEACALVLFHDAAAAARAWPTESAAPPAGEPSPEEDVTRLRHELAVTREYLEGLAEAQGVANENLRVANEEILSSNEELQSTNEEMETAKEELQSANEELVTLNEELHQRNHELGQVNGDMLNLQTSTTIPVVMVGRDLRIRRFTVPARVSLKLLASDIGRPLADLDLPIQVPDLARVVGEVVERAIPHEDEVKDRQGSWWHVRIHPYRTLDHHIDGAVLVFVDIDAAKRSEALLRDSDRRKDVFLATLAHELRNPIAPIRNAVQILRLAGDDGAAAESAKGVLERQVWQLSRIIDDLIDIGRIIEGKIDLRRRRVEVKSVLDLAVETSRSLIEVNGHQLTVSLPAAPLHLDVDAGRITQALVNLLNNAAKYTARGGRISLSAERVAMRRRTDSAVDEVRITVRDTGAGIAPELMPHIFDMFTQGERVYEHTLGGLGVGLSLVRSLVGMHSGRVEVASEGVGLGSEFTVYLPLAPAGQETGSEDAQADDRPLDTAGMARGRILIVDDNLDHVESMVMLLQLQGHEVFSAYDGPTALEVARHNRPDLALVDIGLPGMNGYEVARRLREMPELANLVLVAQTGWGQEEDRRRSAEAGFDHHLVKPVELESVEKILAATRSRRSEVKPGPAEPAGG